MMEQLQEVPKEKTFFKKTIISAKDKVKPVDQEIYVKTQDKI